jgi:PAS domain S-box-containing protein
MVKVDRSSGIGVIGDVTWGTHFCLFYETRADLIDVLVPYFKAGLENNEFCMCITSEPFKAADVRVQMARAIPGFNEYLEKGQVEIIPYAEWYEIDGVFNSERVLNGWVDKLRYAKEKGFSGLRLSGNTFWLEKASWEEFLDYEEAVNDIIGKYDMIALCTYSLGRCDAADILDVVSTHQFALARRDGEWKLIENSELKETKKALRESEERYRGLYESSLDGIVITDMDGNITNANPTYQRMLGYTEEELQHVSYKRLTPARWHDMEARIVQEQIIKRSYSDEYEKEYIRKDGSVFPISIRVWLIKDKRGQSRGMWGIVRDITDSKWAEEKLRNSERLYRAIGESIDYGVWVCAPDGRNIYASESFLKLVGLTQQQCSDFGWGDVLHQDDMKRTIEAWKECVRTEGTWDIEHRYRGVDGQYHPILARGVPVRDEHGEIICWAGINLDISRLKRTEAELNEAKAQAELYLDLMGHDINNMNQVGMGYLEFALETLREEGRIEEKDKELLEKPLRSIQDSSYLIDNVRKLRSSKSKEYQFQPIDLRGVLEGVKEQFLKVNGRQVTINYTPAESHVLATGLVKDVFVNIVGNAVKHSDADKPLEIDISQIHVYGTDESYHKVIIDDNGPGISDELKTRIFNRLEQGNTKAKGKGLGLYLVKTLVHDFNGKIWVEDRVQGDYSQGARFVVMLPAVEK